MTAMITMIALASAAAIFFIVMRVTKGGVVAMLTKALASVFFIGLGVAGAVTINGNTDASVFLLFGLVMGLIGDIILDLKVVYPESNNIYLTSGMVSFSIGHIFYFIAISLLVGSKFNLTTLLICIAIAIGLAAIIMFLSKPLKLEFGKFFAISAGYAFVLVFMGAYSVALAITTCPYMLLMAIGMILFLLSDLVLSTMYFGGKEKDKFMIIVNHALYYAAQICIATFIFMI